MFCKRHLIVAPLRATACKVATAEPLRWVAGCRQGKPAEESEHAWAGHLCYRAGPSYARNRVPTSSHGSLLAFMF